MTPFTFAGQQLRTIDIDGTPWFVAAGVCRCIGLSINKAGQPNVTAACGKLDADESGFSFIETPYPAKLDATTRMRVVNESGLYKLIMRAQTSRPEVKAFQDWVTREVLPAIRRTPAHPYFDKPSPLVKRTPAPVGIT